MVSIFSSTDLFTKYRCTIQVRGKLLGGIPKDPKVIETWLRSKGISQDEEVRQMLMRTLIELGIEVTPDMTYEQMVEASGQVAALKQTNGFKQNGEGLIIESRQIKAAIKESVNILYPWADPDGKAFRWHNKSARNYVAETVFIDCDNIPLGKSEPDGVELMLIHANGPKGPVNSLAYFEYVERPTLAFSVMATRDGVKPEQWAEVWVHAQENGIGACRSQGFGRFDVVQWDKID